MKTLFILIVAFLLIASCTQKKHPVSQFTKYDNKIDSLLSLMTIHEKVGQLNALGAGDNLINPQGEKVDIEAALREGLVGVIQNTRGVDKLTKLQKIAVEESRLGIPILFAADIIHGTEVVFPIPLAFASSWDIESIKEISRIAAIEATAKGLNLTYSPMADLSRDPRWGRVMEGIGEDVYLNKIITKAVVQGYQGDDLSASNTFGACIKHFAAYGAAEGGRDYNTVDMSWRRLREEYLPGYKAGIDAGAASVMVSFNDINGMPSSCNGYLLRDVLRKEWGFEGFVIGDYTSVGELVNHGVAKDLKDAGRLSINAGLDVDMVSMALLKHVPELVDKGKVEMKTVDEAVKNILRVKYALGLMDAPYKYLDAKREKDEVFKPEYLQLAREMAQKSIVLLKNEKQLLPLKKDIKKIAIIGPMVNDKLTPKGEWAFGGSHYENIIPLLSGVKNKISENTEVLYAKGCNANDNNEENIGAAVALARKADVVIAAVGEPLDMIGEARSRTHLNLPGKQMKLLKELKKSGKPIIVLVFSGRPLLMNWIHENIQSIVYVWHLGHESGNAIADVMFGDYNPSGKLTMSFPYSVGQIPVYYNNRTTGRPFKKDYRWCTHYIDNPNYALYPFGYGLSYTNFEYSDIKIDKNQIRGNEQVDVSVNVKNTGEYDGTEIVQLYIQDLVGSITRPVKELKRFKRIELKKGAEAEVVFKITTEDLKFYNNKLEYASEPGEFKIYIGKNSVDLKEAMFELK